jgi:hypothetical protein
MRELAREVLAGEEAWVVGGAVRDELLGRELVDLDIACREPERAARRYARKAGGAPFPLSETHGAWRVAAGEGRTVDFTPLRGSIEDDLATRDFTLNAIAVPLAGGPAVDPFAGGSDLEARVLRAVSPGIFEADPLRLLRAVRLEDELCLRLDAETEALVRAASALVVRPAGERIVSELLRLSADGYRRAGELGLLAPLGGSVDGIERGVDAETRFVAAFGERVPAFPVPNELRRLASALLRAERPPDDSPRSIYRFRRATEPWALEALAWLGAGELRDAVERARASDPAEPLVRGDELGLPPGPAIGRALDAIAEERAAGTISTRDEALALARSLAGEG